MSGENTLVSLISKNNIINVNDLGIDKPLNTTGVYVGNGADYIVNNYDNTTTSIIVNSTSSTAYGILTQFDGNANINTNDFSISIQNNATHSGTGGTDIYAVYSNQANINVDANNSINIIAKNNSTTNISNAYGVRVHTGYAKNNSEFTTFDDALVTLEASNITINSIINNSTGGWPIKSYRCSSVISVFVCYY